MLGRGAIAGLTVGLGVALALGNLRVAYALPSTTLAIADTAVFWQASDAPLFPLAEFPTSDHRLLYVDVSTDTTADSARLSVSGFEFLGEVQIATGTLFEGTEIGGLSGLAYDATRDTYYALSDDRSDIDDARFYTLDIDLSDGGLEVGDIVFRDVTTLLDDQGNPFVSGGIDPEGIAIGPLGTLYVCSEGDTNALLDPFVNEFSLTGQQISVLPIDAKFLPTDDGSSGIRNNQAFESLTITPNGRFLYTATEGALFQDGPSPTVAEGGLARIVKYDLTTNTAVGEFVYELGPIPDEPVPSDAFATNGLVELLAIDNNGTFLALERGFSVGVGNTVKLFQINAQGALDVQNTFALFDEANSIPFAIGPAVTKTKILDIEADLGITPDNLEALAFGPTLPDGRQSLIIASDNNFNPNGQVTQFLAFAIDLETTPAAKPTVETPVTFDVTSSSTAMNVLLVNDAGFSRPRALKSCLTRWWCPSSLVAVAETRAVSRAATLEEIEREAYDLVNAYRLSKGLPGLVWSDEVAAVAREHSEAMAAGRISFSHDGFDDRAARLQSAVSYRRIGENLAFNKGQAQPAGAAVAGWLQSPPHFANMMGDFNVAGMGLAQGQDGSYYFTQIFIKN